jgi:phosphoribosylanthranilate isomerase
MTKIKFCGLRRIEDIGFANRLLPDYAGFVFAPSRRRVDMETAARLRGLLDSRVLSVGVFVQEKISIIAKLYYYRIIDLVQLHGEEDSAYIAHLREYVDCPIIKARAVGPGRPPVREAAADFLLLDTWSEGESGGTGRAFDWKLAGEVRQPFFLAGGLTAGNVAEAIERLRPYAVDLSSGIETGGAKDEAKMAAVMAAAGRRIPEQNRQ